MELGKNAPDGSPEVADLRRRLIEWGRDHFRNYPWRQTVDPYEIFAAEILLHRTRADQVVPLYLVLLRRFPTICELADSDIVELQQLLASAGLRWRINLLHGTARLICRNSHGCIPRSGDELEGLPGIGHYISSAIRCFAYNQPVALLDTNTVRIAGRIYGIPVTDSSRRSKGFRRLLERLVDPTNPRAFNFSLLDLGALVCLPSDPRCLSCPISKHCTYGQERVQSGGAI